MTNKYDIHNLETNNFHSLMNFSEKHSYRIWVVSDTLILQLLKLLSIL